MQIFILLLKFLKAILVSNSVKERKKDVVFLYLIVLCKIFIEKKII